MLGYIYNTEQEAIDSRLLCDTYYGYPKENCDTLHWVSYNYSEIDNFFYIEYVDGLEVILDEPIEFSISTI
jgi:hypothetical protein